MAPPNQGERIARLEEKVSNLVEDMKDVKVQLQKIADNTGPTRSEMNDLRKAIFTALDLDALGNPKQYDEDNHPGRRRQDSEAEKSTFDKVVAYTVNRILPNIIVWTILGLITFAIAVNNHLIVGP